MKNISKTKNTNGYIFYAALAIFCLSTISSIAQDSLTSGKSLRNTIKINLTSQLLYNDAIQIGYERLIGKNQSLNIVAGYNEFPTNLSLNLANTQFSGSGKKSGNMFGVDYRFYLQKENKYSSPHGIYLAPYISYYRFKGERTLTHTDSTGMQTSVNSHTKINFLNVGGELGYQFVLWKYFVIDAVVFGPAITKYDFNVTLDGSLPDLSPDETQQAIIDALKDKFPLLNDLSKNHQASGSGHEAFWSVGFRYNISIGFRF